ncbi:MAG: V-type ATPase subunit [Eubacteriales bacterium]|nr:V-type ATPase subunit [Eubacteriales bacterium]
MSTEREAYLCLSAILRTREPKLLNNDRAVRMLEAGSFEDAAKLLGDCGYADMSQMTAREIEECLNDHRSEIFCELDRLCPQKLLVDVFRMKYDYHNAKTVIKSEAMGLDPKHLFSNSGRIKGEELLSLYNDELYTRMPGFLGVAMEEAKNTLARTNNPQLADFILDRFYFCELRHAAKDVDCDFLTGYFHILVDSANLKTAVRTLRMGKDADFMSDALIKHGSVDIGRIRAAGDKDALNALFAHGRLEKAAALGAEATEGGSMTAFELACDNAVNTYLRTSKLVSYGPEAVIAYIAAVEGEITAVRMILTGKLAGIAPQTIRERLRDLYA